MTTEDKAKLDQLYTSKKRSRTVFSSRKLDELIVDATNAGKLINEIVKEVQDLLGIKLTDVQLRTRLSTLRRYGIKIAHKYNLKKVNGRTIRVAGGSKGTIRVANNKTNKAKQAVNELSIQQLARVGAILRFSDATDALIEQATDALIEQYIYQVVREAVRIDLERNL